MESSNVWDTPWFYKPWILECLSFSFFPKEGLKWVTFQTSLSPWATENSFLTQTTDVLDLMGSVRAD